MFTQVLDCVQAGSYGTCEFAKLPYFRLQYHAPFAIYHILILGIWKDLLGAIVRRLNTSQLKDGKVDPKEALLLATLRPSLSKAILTGRLQHARLRSSPSCTAVNFMEHLGAMTIEEVQLLVEVLSPYLFHDMTKFGFKRDLLVMWWVSSADATFLWDGSCPFGHSQNFATAALEMMTYWPLNLCVPQDFLEAWHHHLDTRRGRR